MAAWGCRLATCPSLVGMCGPSHVVALLRFVSGHRFSDAANRSKSDSSLGAELVTSEVFRSRLTICFTACVRVSFSFDLTHYDTNHSGQLSFSDTHCNPISNNISRRASGRCPGSPRGGRPRTPGVDRRRPLGSGRGKRYERVDRRSPLRRGPDRPSRPELSQRKIRASRGRGARLCCVPTGKYCIRRRSESGGVQMDFRHARTCCSLHRVEWRGPVYNPRSAVRNFNDKLHAGCSLRDVFFRRACVVLGCPVPAHFKCRADRAESWREHGASAVGIWKVLWEEVARSCGSEAPPRALPRLDGESPVPTQQQIKAPNVAAITPQPSAEVPD